MKKSYQKIRQYMNTRSLEIKLLVLVFLLFLAICAIILFVTTLSFRSTLMNKSQQLVDQQIATVATNISSSLDDYTEMMRILVLDDNIQEYLELAMDNQSQTAVTNAVYNSLTIVCNTKQNIDYIAIIPIDEQSYLYSGDSLIASDFLQWALEDYENASQQESGSMRYSMTYSETGDYSFNLYYPIYHPSVLGKQLGILCLRLDNSMLTQFYEMPNSSLGLEISMTDLEGTVLSDTQNLIGTSFAHMDEIVDVAGSFLTSDSLYVYREMDEWDFYLVGTVSLNQLLSETVYTLLFLSGLIALILCLAVVLAKRGIHGLYQPLVDVRESMKRVSDGDFSVRVETKDIGEDIQQMAESFNVMVVQVEELMEKVKEEQHQIERIEFNALQSQIKPHFLYNTLECIHWQALADGNQEISTLVKALANYYRICLSNGQDIIPLSQELAHINNYLIIQNQRYGNIIDMETQVPKLLHRVMLPNMTLQPLVENSIYHGIKVKNGQSGMIRITAQLDGTRAIISVMDSGSGVSQQQIDDINSSISIFDEAFGYGVRNVHKRIEILFGKGYGLWYRKNETGGITVDISVPFDMDSQKEF